jgi:hypothetical protein
LATAGGIFSFDEAEGKFERTQKGKRKTAVLTGSSGRRLQSSNSLLASDALRLTKRQPHYV